MKKKNSKKRKLNKKRICLFLLILLLFLTFFYKIFTIKITNIYVKGNNYLTDQEIIDIAGLKDYPKSIEKLSLNIENELNSNEYIRSAKVSKKRLFSEIYISIEENYPLFYYQTENKYVLYDGKKVNKIFSVPTVINQIPNDVYDNFIKQFRKIDKSTIDRISEIEYNPNDVDNERFLLLMNDGNYVYITIDKFLTMNKYLDMINSFNNKKGILHLDSGEYFDVFD